MGWEFITYRKGNYTALPIADFETVVTKIGDRTYAHAPADVDMQGYNRYETQTTEHGAKKKILVGMGVKRISLKI